MSESSQPPSSLPSDNPEQHEPLTPVSFQAPVAEDSVFMDLALEQARLARDLDEVPVGAVVVLDGRVVGRGHNRVRARGEPTAHAEILALQDGLSSPRRRAASRGRGVHHPGTLFHVRRRLDARARGACRLGVRDPKFGGCVSLGRVLQQPGANHRADCTEGVGAEAARELLQSFFRSKRRAGPNKNPQPGSSRDR